MKKKEEEKKKPFMCWAKEALLLPELYSPELKQEAVGFYSVH